MATLLAYAAVEDYYLEIESHFAAKRGTPFVLSAKDWMLMKKWHDDGVPLPVVIEAIDTVFEKNESSGRKKVISSLSYCRHAVKEIWEERKELYVGGGESPEASPEPLLSALASEVAVVSPEFAERIRELVREKSVPKIEEALIALEQELIEDLLSTTDVDAIRAEVAKALGDTSRLDEKTRSRTEEANLRRIVRERFALPRLTLFR